MASGRASWGSAASGSPGSLPANAAADYHIDSQATST